MLGWARGGAGFESSGSFVLDLSLFDWLIFQRFELGTFDRSLRCSLSCTMACGRMNEITPSLYLTIGHNRVSKSLYPMCRTFYAQKHRGEPPHVLHAARNKRY